MLIPSMSRMCHTSMLQVSDLMLCRITFLQLTAVTIDKLLQAVQTHLVFFLLFLCPLHIHDHRKGCFTSITFIFFLTLSLYLSTAAFTQLWLFPRVRMSSRKSPRLCTCVNAQLRSVQTWFSRHSPECICENDFYLSLLYLLSIL